MRITVQDIGRPAQGNLVVAKVRAASRDRVRGIPRAIIHMWVQFELPDRDVSERVLKRLAREEALRFLDVS